MPTETTATLLVGPLDTQWGAGVFGPDHVLLLREGFRAVWTVAPTSPDGVEVDAIDAELALASDHGLRLAVTRDSSSDAR